MRCSDPRWRLSEARCRARATDVSDHRLRVGSAGRGRRTDPSTASVVRAVDRRMVPYLIETTLIPTAVGREREVVRLRHPGLRSCPAPPPRRRTDAALDVVFKAYDIRGSVPDQLDARCAGPSALRSLGSGRTAPPRPRRPRHAVVRASRRRLLRRRPPQGADVSTSVSSRPTRVLRRRPAWTRPPPCSPRRTTRPSTTASSSASRAPARSGRTPDWPTSRRWRAPAPTVGSCEPPGRGQRAVDLLDDFADHVLSFVDTSVLEPLKVVADTANGMGGLVVPQVFARLPFDLEVMYGELDGTFPNHPADPIQPENRRDLQRGVLRTGADVGLAFDGDADRVFFVDETGAAVSGSTTTAIVASGDPRQEPGATILHNLICSGPSRRSSATRGHPDPHKVGHSFIKQVMAETGAAFGGEHSAHYYFRDNYRADSGIIATMVVLEQLSRAGIPLSELRQPFERYADSGEINTQVDDVAAAVERVAERYRSCGQDHLDGLTVDCGDWWFNLRPSNTEPLLRLNVEAPTPAECDERVAEVLSLITPDDDPAHEWPLDAPVGAQTATTWRGAAGRQHGAVDVDVALDHRRLVEPVDGRGPDRGRSSPPAASTARTASSTPSTRNPVTRVGDQLGHRAPAVGDDRRAAGHRLDDAEAERLVEVDEVEQGVARRRARPTDRRRRPGRCTRTRSPSTCGATCSSK